MTNHPAAEQMFQECLRYSLPRAYHRDFILHDLVELERIAEESTMRPFMWLLRESGTHLFFDSVPRQVTRLFAYEERHFYVWADGKLSEHLIENSHSIFQMAVASWRKRTIEEK